MKAAVYREYGGPEVVSIEERARPEPAAGEILVKVAHGSVTTADWRLRAAAFPGVMALPGRLMFGARRPKLAVLGSEFAGHVAALGAGVQGFDLGQAVFGFVMNGAHAEYLAVRADGAVMPVPEGVPMSDAAAVPFGGLSALVFLRDYARVMGGQRVLVVGASGGVGAYAVQIASAMGAEVTGVASGEHEEFVRSLGAVAFVDYRLQDLASLGGRYDVVLDTVGAVNFADIRRALAPGGVFVPLNWGLGEIWQAVFGNLVRRLAGRRKVRIGVSGDTRADLEILAKWLADGTLRAVVDSRFGFGDIREAYRKVERRHRQGAVLLDIAA